MLGCISVGISEYENTNLGPIPCAEGDACAVYDAFREIMGDEFNGYLSVCVSNIRSIDFEFLLNMVSDAVDSGVPTSDSLLVVYFSGHGAYNDNTFELRFPGFKGNGRGSDDSFSIDQLSNIFRGKEIRVLVILDCCNSGAALTIANNNDQGPEISVFAAVNSYESAKFSEDGSAFTKILCRSIHEIDCSGEEFSLNSLVNRIKSNGYQSAHVHRGAAKELDLVFRHSLVNTGYDKYFSSLFVDKISRSNLLSREALWYSLNSFPDKIVFETSELYFNLDGHYRREYLPEASWLVRRAIGSTLANHLSNPSTRNLLYRLLESEYWQNQCIALIGLRYCIREDNEVYKRVIGLVKKKIIKRVDAVWLAALYASDNDGTDWEIFLDTTLALTPWGMIELCKAYKLLDENLENYDCLKNHCFFEDLVKEQERQAKKASSKLEQCVYGEKTRGRLPENTQAKFLLSALYGNWRDQIVLKLRPYIECNDQDVVMSELRDFGAVKNAERKMAVLTYFNREPEDGERFSTALEWGLDDAHPWVRRTAAVFFQMFDSYKEPLKNSYRSACFTEDYPGLLDFYLTCPADMRQELICHLKEKSILTRGDFLCLKQSLLCE